MENGKWFGVVSAVVMALLFSCSSSQKLANKELSPSDKELVVVRDSGQHPAQVEQVLTPAGEHVVSSIRFPMGQSKLTASARTELAQAVEAAKKSGGVEDVTVVVWSDREYPPKNQKLPKAQVNLAENRGEEIENYLEDDLATGSVSVHNMAKHPTAINRFLRTTDARLKKELVAAGIAPAADGAEVTGRSSTALVIVQTKAN